MRKPLTCEAIVRAAELLMALRGHATPAAVRRHLEAENYYAAPTDVAYLMRHLALIEGWAWSETDDPTYTLPEADAAPRCFVLHLN